MLHTSQPPWTFAKQNTMFPATKLSYMPLIFSVLLSVKKAEFLILRSRESKPHFLYDSYYSSFPRHPRDLNHDDLQLLRRSLKLRTTDNTRITRSFIFDFEARETWAMRYLHVPYLPDLFSTSFFFHFFSFAQPLTVCLL